MAHVEDAIFFGHLYVLVYGQIGSGVGSTWRSTWHKTLVHFRWVQVGLVEGGLHRSLALTSYPGAAGRGAAGLGMLTFISKKLPF